MLPNEADTWLPNEGGHEPGRPGLGGKAVDSVERARAYDALFKRAAEPRTLGRYVVLDSLGQGGFGVVLRAYDRQLDRAVALKVLHRAIDVRHAQRLRREAQAMAKLSHPNVVQVYEVGEVDGLTFVAMELIKGQTVRAWMEQQPRPGWRACVELFVQLGAGLAAAHEQGLVHRDFKPGNAMIDGKGRARVLDFGLARLEEDEAADEPSAAIQKVREEAYAQMLSPNDLTQTGMVLGTPAYMALEQMSGQPADARSDQFSFCVALYEAVYGERPYEGDMITELFVSMHDDQVRPAPPGRDVPLALRRVLLRGLAGAAKERWPSMEALLEALQRVAAPRRRRGTAVVVGVGLLAVGGGLGTLWTLDWLERCTGARKQLAGVWDDARRQEVKSAVLGTGLSYAPGTWERVELRLDAYAEEWAAEHTDACEATHSRGEQSEEEMSLRMGCLYQRWRHLRATVGELGRADATVVERAVQAVTSLPGLSRCRDLEALRAEVPPPEDPAVAEQVTALDEVLVAVKAKYAAGKYEDGLRLADEVADKGEALDYEPLMARAWQQQGRLRIEMGEYEAAVSALKRAFRASVAQTMTAEAADASVSVMRVLGESLARHEEARGWAEYAEPLSRAAGTDDARVKYLNDLGIVAHSQGKYEEARDLCEQALAIREKVHGLDHPNVVASLESLGNVAKSQARYEEAHDFHERALAIREKALGPAHPHVATSFNNLATLAESQGEYEKARDFFGRALTILDRALGSDHPTVAASLNNLGNVAESQGEYEEARDFFERALAIREKALSSDHPNVAASLRDLGRVVQSQGEYEEARDFFERARAIFDKALGPDHPYVALSLRDLGNVADLLGEHEAARDSFERALAIFEQALGPEHPNVAALLINVGNVAKSQGKYEESRDFFERALAILDEALGPEHPNVAASLINLGAVVKSQGEYAKARELHERALAILEKALGPEHPKVAASLDRLGDVAHSQGEYAKAQELYERALAIRRKGLGPDHPDVASSLHGLGNVAHSQGEYDKARQWYERALGIREKALGPDHPDVARLLNNLGSGADLRGKYEESRDFHERALAILETALGPDHPDVASLLNNLGDVAYSRGEYDKARALYERALAGLEKSLGPDHPRVAYPLTGLGEAHLALGTPADALPVLERALVVRVPDEVDPADLAENRALLARALWTAPASEGRDRPRARALAEQARDAYATLGDAWKTELAETKAWLAEHRVR
ncbi:MAG: tetratricopeptide repeat protein [Myxococcota bacterium]